jgi:hypothetical protein
MHQMHRPIWLAPCHRLTREWKTRPGVVGVKAAAMQSRRAMPFIAPLPLPKKQPMAHSKEPRFPLECPRRIAKTETTRSRRRTKSNQNDRLSSLAQNVQRVMASAAKLNCHGTMDLATRIKFVPLPIHGRYPRHRHRHPAMRLVAAAAQ